MIGLDSDLADDLLNDYRHVTCEEIDSYDTLNSLFSNNIYNDIKIFHINIRSYYKNFDSLLILLERLKIKFDIIVLSECWTDEDKLFVHLDGYDIFYTTGNFNRNDGIVCYSKTELGVLTKQITLGEAKGLTLDFHLPASPVAASAV